MLFNILYVLFYIPLRIIYPFRVIGKKHVPKKGRMILVSNHQTMRDPVILGLGLPRKFKYMAKKGLFKNKFIGWFLRKMGAYSVDYKSVGDIQALKTTMDLLKKERAICMFPEGTRLKSNESNDIKSGTAIFSLKMKAPIVPSFVVKKPCEFKFNTLLVGEPIKLYEMEEFKDKKITEELLKEANKIISQGMYNLQKNYLAKKTSKEN